MTHPVGGSWPRDGCSRWTFHLVERSQNFWAGGDVSRNPRQMRTEARYGWDVARNPRQMGMLVEVLPSMARVAEFATGRHVHRNPLEIGDVWTACPQMARSENFPEHRACAQESCIHRDVIRS